jgi:DNA invertase Pin-like site-specific DNA recombinase
MMARKTNEHEEGTNTMTTARTYRSTNGARSAAHEGQSGRCMPVAAARARCYVRVSDKELNPENQKHELEAMAARLGLEIEHVHTDVVSGAKAGRAGLERALADAKAGAYDVLLIWALDRLSREGVAKMLGYLEQLKQSGVRVMSCRESWLDSDSPAWELLVSIFAWTARQERERLRERVVTGMERARRQGVRIGRPARAVDVQEVTRRREQGETWRAIAMAMHCPARTLWRAYHAATVGGAISQLVP